MHELLPFVTMLIPIIAIIMGIGIGMLALVLNYRKRKEMFALYHQERMAAIDKGIELPPLPDAFFTDNGNPSKASPHRQLLTGLVLLFIGIILFCAFYYRGNIETGLFTLIPGGIGLAYLIYYFAVGRKQAAALEAAAKKDELPPPQTPAQNVPGLI